MRTITSFLLLVVFLLSISSCKKDIVESDFETSSDFIKILNFECHFVGSQFKQDDGNSIITFSKTINNSYGDIGIALIDENGHLISSAAYGGKYHETMSYNTADDQGNIYVVGATQSPELRMDEFKTQTNNKDAYIIKFDKNGNKLWERGYSDTSGGSKGALDDEFTSVIASGNKVYCFGETQNYYPAPYPDPDSWLVVFDENGNVLEDRLLPSRHTGPSAQVRVHGALELANGDILFRWVISAIAGTRSFDTSSLMLRYNPAMDSILWIEYYETASDAGDALTLGEAEDGTILALNSFNTQMLKYDGTNGKFLGASETGFSSAGSTEELTYLIGSLYMFDFNGFHYVVGAVDNGITWSYAAGYGWGQFNDSRPWVMKFTDDGEIVYSKTYDVPKGGLSDMRLNEDGNLELLGSISTFGTFLNAPFFMTIDQDGNIITP